MRSIFYVGLWVIFSSMIQVGISQPVQAQMVDSAIPSHIQQDKNAQGEDLFLLFQDDFNDGDADGWTTYGLGTWSVINGEYVVDMGSGNSLLGYALAGNMDWTDYIFEADVNSIQGENKAICFRCNNANSYFVNIVGNPYNLLLLGRGVDLFVTLYYPNTSGYWYHVKVILMGANISVYVNDQMLINYTDSNTNWLKQGGIGVNGWTGAGTVDNVRFDNVIVRAIKPIHLPLITNP